MGRSSSTTRTSRLRPSKHSPQAAPTQCHSAVSTSPILTWRSELPRGQRWHRPTPPTSTILVLRATSIFRRPRRIERRSFETHRIRLTMSIPRSPINSAPDLAVARTAFDRDAPSVLRLRFPKSMRRHRRRPTEGGRAGRSRWPSSCFTTLTTIRRSKLLAGPRSNEPPPMGCRRSKAAPPGGASSLREPDHGSLPDQRAGASRRAGCSCDGSL